MQINIIGIRGVPAAHGGFESFAARFAPYMIEQGHDVLVYCQDDDGAFGPFEEDMWEGVRRVHVQPRRNGAVGTMDFDLQCIRDVAKRPGVDLVLGYNTAIFSLHQRMARRKIAINMDGIEWKRAKWSFPAKSWFFVNELLGANLAHVAIADHPEIARHVARRTRKEPVMIPYGSDRIESADVARIEAMGLAPHNYFVSIARVEPENSILELVQAFSKVDGDSKCVILGRLDETNAYHRAVRAAGNDRVVFPGAIYDQKRVQALRYFAAAYLHGHQVGGTNPSLVEALGAGRPVIAHDNRFNRWTAGEEQLFFSNRSEAAQAMRRIAGSNDLQDRLGQAALGRHQRDFTFDKVHRAYEEVLVRLANQ
ncbi:DUF1972 domain-containing protein [Qipengyuania sp. XHP0211]|uniref:DUF1972 domain-containing protein n=1 Tax=Qipengyuania sp. XHP0211 TaxID=3038079 RepID=UPI00241D6F84|nr:DUF1972 domain-containing protein [Qipengyuania sp. XHP0211]MDG5750967.1 DUF1972 domain-containing protein [Qipengyuania sp. XHP0211]